MHFFDIGNIAFQVLGYQVSYVEFIGTLFGLVSVYYASRANILTWSIGIVNEILMFILFFQVQLYADMFLQVYFFVVTLYGWYQWNRNTSENKISAISLKNRIKLGIIIAMGSFLMGYLINNIHLYLPQYFKVQAAFPYIDSFVMVLSIVGCILLAKKKIENWYLWLVVNAICIVLYFKKEVYFLSLEYVIFLLLAYYGLYHWKKQLNLQSF